MSYTPGPWEWDSDDNDLVIRPRRITEDNEVSVIAVLPLESYEYLEDWSECSWSAEGEANARLMAAAPDAVESLRALVEHCEDYAVYLKTLGPEFREDYLNLKNGINKAAGILRDIDGTE